MNFVDFMIDCYSHITSHASQVFAHTLHELLFAKHCTCYCVWLWFDQPSFCKYFELCANLICCLKICGECKNFVFGNFGLKILDLKIISSHTHAFFFLNFNALS